MAKLDPAVRKEILRISGWSIGLSAVMEAVFLILGKWTPAVLGGNLVGVAASLLNYILLAVTVQKIVSKGAAAGSKEEIAARMRTSKSLRMLMMVALCVAYIVIFRTETGATLATLIPLVFPRIALIFRPRSGKTQGTETENEGSELLE